MSALAVPVVLVDDHHMVVLGLRTLFHNRPEIDVVAFAHDAEDAMACVRERHPRVVVLDVALEGSHIDGFELCRRLRTEHEDVEVVFYTGVDELGLAERAFARRRPGRRLQGRLGRRPAQGGAARLARAHLRVTGVRRARRPPRLRGPLAEAARGAAAARARAWSASRSPSRWASARRP